MTRSNSEIPVAVRRTFSAVTSRTGCAGRPGVAALVAAVPAMGACSVTVPNSPQRVHRPAQRRLGAPHAEHANAAAVFFAMPRR